MAGGVSGNFTGLGRIKMKLFFEQKTLADYISKQLHNSFPFGSERRTRNDVLRILPAALERTEHCFSKVKAKYFQRNGEAFFSPLMTDQYAMFLYFLANTSFKEGQDTILADRLYGLNKMLHSIDVYYQIELPRVFLFVHSVGTVLGRAQYGEYLAIYQGVTVGGNLKDEYPVIGDHVSLFSNCSVIGRSVVGDNSMVAARSCLVDAEVPDGRIVFGMSPNAGCSPRKNNVTEFIC